MESEWARDSRSATAVLSSYLLRQLVINKCAGSTRVCHFAVSASERSAPMPHQRLGGQTHIKRMALRKPAGCRVAPWPTYRIAGLWRLLADVDDETSLEEASSWALPLARWSEAWRPSVRTAHCAEVEQVLLATGPLCLSTAVLNSCLVRGLARLAGRGECPTHRIRRLSRRGQWCGRW